MDTVDFHIFAAFSTTLMNNANPSQPVYKTVVPSQACSSVLAKTSLFFFFFTPGSSVFSFTFKVLLFEHQFHFCGWDYCRAPLPRTSTHSPLMCQNSTSSFFLNAVIPTNLYSHRKRNLNKNKKVTNFPCSVPLLITLCPQKGTNPHFGNHCIYIQSNLKRS